jgi:hypothetical protein
VYNVPYRNCIYNRLPEDEPAGSKHVVDIKTLKIKILFWKMFILLVSIVQLYCSARRKKHEIRKNWRRGLCFTIKKERSKVSHSPTDALFITH